MGKQDVHAKDVKLVGCENERNIMFSNKAQFNNPDFEDKNLDRLFVIESSIIKIYRQNPNLIDAEVLIALDAVILDFKNLQRGYAVKIPNFPPLVQMVYENIKAACNTNIQQPDAPVKDLTTEVAVVFLCLQRIKTSVRRWNKENGRQWYLNFVRDYV